jgi:hypothetical protein
MAWLGWLTGVGLLLAVLAGSHVTGEFELTRARSKDRLTAEVRALFGWVRYRYQIPEHCYERLLQKWIRNKQLQGDAKKRRERMRQKAKLLLQTDGFFAWMRNTMRHVKCGRFRWIAKLGTGDAAGTGTTSGLAWGLQSAIAGFLLNEVILETRPELAVVPQFQEEGFHMELDITVRIRLYVVVFALGALAWRILRSKGGFARWRTLLSRSG